MEDDEFELPTGMAVGDEPPYEDRVHDALLEAVEGSRVGTTASNISGGIGGSHRARARGAPAE